MKKTKFECKNMPLLNVGFAGIECKCGSMTSTGKRIYCYLHDKSRPLGD